MVSTDLRIILSNFVATDVYALFKKSIKKNLQHNVQNEGGGGQRLFEQCSKKLRIWWRWPPLIIVKHDSWDDILIEIIVDVGNFISLNIQGLSQLN